MNKQSLENLGYRFKEQDQNVKVTYITIFQTGHPDWDGDVSWDSMESDAGEYKNMRSAIETVAKNEIMAMASEKLDIMEKTVLNLDKIDLENNVQLASILSIVKLLRQEKEYAFK